MIKVGIIGAAGYTAGELIRLLIHHQHVQLVTLQSESQAGRSITEIHRDLIGETDLHFSAEIHPADLDVVFLCKGHGESKQILQSNPELLKLRIVDLSHDFRLKGDHDFVYGLPEWNRQQIMEAQHIANPGCFATAIQLGLLPAFSEKMANGPVGVSGITGSTGAGQSLSTTSHFSWRSNNASVYKALTHQHLLEIDETLKSIHPSFDSKVHFVPYRGAFTRGIITTSHFETEMTQEELLKVYKEFYHDHSFTHVVTSNPDLKMVVNSNKCLVYPQVINGTAIVISVIDNLLKGASGQAVQNMNLMFGLDETSGLHIKNSVF